MQNSARNPIVTEKIEEFILLMMWVWNLTKTGYFSPKNWIFLSNSVSTSDSNEFINSMRKSGTYYQHILTYIFDMMFFSHNTDSKWDSFLTFHPTIGMDLNIDDWEGFIQDCFNDDVYYREDLNLEKVKFTSLRALSNSLPDQLPLVNAFKLFESQVETITEFTIGTLFEHLLSEKTRSSTGAFYTPQNITHLLAKKSLFHHLVSSHVFCNTLDEKTLDFNYPHILIEHLQQECDTIPIEDQDKWFISLFNAISSAKILDPAMGSGHFLIAALEELLNLYDYYWKKIKSPTVDPFLFTLQHILPRQIYGVDINPKAVFVAKLRCVMILLTSKTCLPTNSSNSYTVLLNLQTGNSLIGFFQWADFQNKLEALSHKELKACILDQLRDPLLQISQATMNSEINATVKFPKLQQLCTMPSELSEFQDSANFLDLIQEILRLHLTLRINAHSSLGTEEFWKKNASYRALIQNSKFIFDTLFNLLMKNTIKSETRHLFHWILEFPEVFLSHESMIKSTNKIQTNSPHLSRDSTCLPGFHIILGNPPYGNLLNVSKKRIISQFASFPKEISSVFIERAIDLNRRNGILDFITSYVICFSKDLSKTRSLIASQYQITLIATFDRDKCRLFEGMTQSVSLLQCIFKQKPTKNFFPVYTTVMYRELPSLENLSYLKANEFLLGHRFPTTFHQKHRLPKCGDRAIYPLLSLFDSLSASESRLGEKNCRVLGDILSSPIIIRNPVDFKTKIDPSESEAGQIIWYRISGNYWYNAWDRIPYFGTQIATSRILHKIPHLRSFLILLINSSLFYTWYRIFSDGRHTNTDIWKVFPLPFNLLEKLNEFGLYLDELFHQLMSSLFAHFDSKHNRFHSSEIKPIIDVCDLLLGIIYQIPTELIKTIQSWEPTIRGGLQLSKNEQNSLVSSFSSPDLFGKFKETLHLIEKSLSKNQDT